MYQLFLNGEPYVYSANNTIEDARVDLRGEYDVCARSSSTVSISDIVNDGFEVELASGRLLHYPIESF